MDRRDFFKLAAMTGLAVTGAARNVFADEPLGTPTEQGGEGPEFGPMFIQIQATGGWDPTFVCDPKAGRVAGMYSAEDVPTDHIPYAPIGGEDGEWYAFFEGNHDRMIVFNGVDVRSNNHEAGRRNMASGRLSGNHPSLAAMVAGFQGSHLPVSLMSFGGYEETGNLVAPTRDLDANRLAGIAYPDRINPSDGTSERYHSSAIRGRIALARERRMERMRQSQGLPKLNNSMGTLHTARMGSEQLKRLEEILPALNGNTNKARAQLAIAAYSAGIGTSLNIAMGGFDTHSNHNAAHSEAMRRLLDLVNFIWNVLDTSGLSEHAIMLISSDFARTDYNGNAGKDHWPISSMIAVSGMPGFAGNRVVGATDAAQNAKMIDSETLEVTDDPEMGVVIRPDHIHRSLRDFLGMGGSELDMRYPLETEVALPLLG